MPIVPHHWVENGEVELALGGGISRTGTGTGEQRYDTTAQTTLQWTLSVSMEPEDSGIEIEVGEEITIRIDSRDTLVTCVGFEDREYEGLRWRVFNFEGKGYPPFRSGFDIENVTVRAVAAVAGGDALPAGENDPPPTTVEIPAVAAYLIPNQPDRDRVLARLREVGAQIADARTEDDWEAAVIAEATEILTDLVELFEGKRPPDKFFADALRAGESVGGLKRLASTTRKALGESARFVTDMDRLREVAEEIWEFLS